LSWAETAPANQLHVLNRVTWGANSSALAELNRVGLERYLEDQLQPNPRVALPLAVQSQIAALEITQKTLTQQATMLENERQAFQTISNDDAKKTAQEAYQKHLNTLAQETATRAILRDLYSSKQLQEQMTWFWLNHFSIFQGKANIRFMLADYEDQIRNHGLGRFRDLLSVTAHHPAMLRFLDNEQNAVGHINENYAREIMELHTLGIDGGYSQQDVQALARILTGVGVSLNDKSPTFAKQEMQKQYVRDGVFEFNPRRHDYSDKMFLGQTVKGRGLAEVDEVLDRLARHPATAHFISLKLAQYFVSEHPPTALVECMAQSYLAHDGQIASVLRTMFQAPEFHASLTQQFKDPVHYVTSAVRLAYDDKVILNAKPMINWLNRMGQLRFGRQTPDGYPMTEAAWASSGQMTTRFEIAKNIGNGNAGLFKSDNPAVREHAAFPQLANALYYQAWQGTLSANTKSALDQATSPQEWNEFLLSSPEFMHR
jgi:uncharacterized protein (DUF1800 family)